MCSFRAKPRRLRAQTKAIRWVNGGVLCLFALSVGGLAVASALPQKRKLAAKELEFQRILESGQRDDGSATGSSLLYGPDGGLLADNTK